MEPFKMTKNNECKNSIDLSKVFVLGFRMQIRTSSGQEMPT